MVNSNLPISRYFSPILFRPSKCGYPDIWTLDIFVVPYSTYFTPEIGTPEQSDTSLIRTLSL